MIDILNNIRPRNVTMLSIQQKLLHSFLVLLVGAALGFLAKYLDGSIVGLIGTELVFWILVTTIIAAWSCSPKLAALHVLIFLVAMLTVYYIYSMVLFGFFLKYYFISWGSIALFSPIWGFFIWYARGNGWIAALCAAFPISFLLIDGWFFFRTLTIPLYHMSIPTGFTLLSGILLFIILPNDNLQRLRILPFVMILYFVIKFLDVWSYLP